MKVRPGVGQQTVTVWLIDWKNPGNNHFGIAEEVTVAGKNTKRPDLVLYVNGIALGVLELKRSTVSVSEGIRQNLDNQKAEFIQPFFATVQLVLAGNDTEGLRYGVIETPEKKWLRWKEDESHSIVDESPLLHELGQLCAKERLLELVHDFIVFDAGTKKICRHNQYFGVRAAQARVERREGGIIWHTQGSGKSLTMVWLAKWIREHVAGARVLLITDRTELDDQIESVFKGVGEDIRRTRSGAESGAGAGRSRGMARLLPDPQVRRGGGRRRRRLRRGTPAESAQGLPRGGRVLRFRGRVPPHAVREAPRCDAGPAAGSDAHRVHGDPAPQGRQAAEHRDVRTVHPYLQVRRGGA